MLFSRLQPLAKLSKNRSLRRTGIGFALFNAAEYGEWIAVLVYAYAHGGASTTGVLAFAQLAPCVILAPIPHLRRPLPTGAGACVGVRGPGRRHGDVGRRALASAPPLVVYAFAILAAPAFNVTRPTVNVLLPVAVHTPDELTAGNAALGWIESAGVVVGPFIAAAVITFGGPGTVVAMFAFGMAVAAWVALPLTRSLPTSDPAGPGYRSRKPLRGSGCSPASAAPPRWWRC